ncbi:MAG: endonuclease III [Christensenellaceae bacterium]|nr:endonuclease III [Christensenellaceae bacterium]MBR3842715.1 endonuclease III [Christensenellaceae bacterium]
MKSISIETKNEIMKRLEEVYIGAKPSLLFENPFELLIATILSAQCTDVRVNKVTRVLFPKYPTPSDLAQAEFSDVAEIIKSCGCYQVKAKNIIATAKLLVSDYGGEVPPEMDELVKLPGVGRKTANVVLSNAFDIPGFAVDTHIMRVSYRIGLSENKGDPLKIEKDLCALFPRERWGEAHHWLIYHGRQVCSAKKPACESCFLHDICRFIKDDEA